MEVRQRPRQFSWPLSAQETLRLHRLAVSTQTGPRQVSSPWQVPAPVCTPAMLRARPPARPAAFQPSMQAVMRGSGIRVRGCDRAVRDADVQPGPPHTRIRYPATSGPGLRSAPAGGGGRGV